MGGECLRRADRGTARGAPLQRSRIESGGNRERANNARKSVDVVVMQVALPPQPGSTTPFARARRRSQAWIVRLKMRGTTRGKVRDAKSKETGDVRISMTPQTVRPATSDAD